MVRKSDTVKEKNGKQKKGSKANIADKTSEKAPDDTNEGVKYQIVEFSEERKGSKRMVDFVPAKWIDFEAKIGKCVAKFLDGKIGPDEMTLLDGLRKTEADAPESWGRFPVILRGEAKTFKEAMSKAITVETELYAYSTDNEEHAERKSIAAMKRYEERSRNDKVNDLSTIMEFEDGTGTSGMESTESSADGSESETSMDSERTIQILNQKRKKKSPVRSGQQTNKIRPPLKKKKSGTNGEQISSPRPEQQSSGKSSSKPPMDKSGSSSSRQERSSQEVSHSQQERSSKQKYSKQPPATSDTLKENLDERLKKFSPDTQLLYQALTELTVVVKQNSIDIKDLRRAIESVVKKKINPVTVDVIVEKFGVTLPLHTHADLDDLNTKLTSDAEFCTEFVTALQHLVQNELPKTVVSISKKIFDRLLAMECTAVKKVNGKYLLRDTKIYTVLFELGCAHHNGAKNEPLTEKEFQKALSSAIYNAKDWDGYRSLRNKQIPPPPEAPPGAVLPPVVAVAVPQVQDDEGENLREEAT